MNSRILKATVIFAQIVTPNYSMKEQTSSEGNTETLLLSINNIHQVSYRVRLNQFNVQYSRPRPIFSLATPFSNLTLSSLLRRNKQKNVKSCLFEKKGKLMLVAVNALKFPRETSLPSQSRCKSSKGRLHVSGTEHTMSLIIYSCNGNRWKTRT